ncbi:MAG TPA: bifunctional UDP-sugar hydrolase/5'-nucleotidase [bacterium]|nr:bifunctional UDP-sugar hydrolase/5'-nucleotidase [bacterium]
MNFKKRYFLIMVLGLLVLFNCGQQPKTDQVTIIHWNDLHSANLPYKPTYRNPEGFKVGGYANLAGYLDSLRKAHPEAVALHAGDDFQGSPVSSITKGQSQILIMNAVGLDAFTIGNHEFDYGFEKLKENVELANFPIVSSNIMVKKTQELFVKPYVILESGDSKIGVIGLAMEDLKGSSLPQNVAEIKLLDTYNQVQKYADSIEEKVDLTVVLSHQGFHEDSVLATRLEKVDAIIGGHSHSWLSRPVNVNNILVCQVGARGERLGVLNAKIDTRKNEIINHNYEFIRTIVGKVPPNKKVKHIVDSLDARIAERMNQKIGTLKNDWIRDSRDESNIGNWFTDAMRRHFNTDIAFQNSGGIRKNLSAGPITVRDIWEICPFDNTVEIVKVDGEALKAIMEWRADNPRDLLQVSGLKWTYNSKKEEMIELTVNGKEVDEDQEYTIATNNYITGHAERFFGRPASKLDIKHTGVIGRDILIEDVKKQGVISGQKENRIIDVARN